MATNWWLANLTQPFKWSTTNTQAHSGVDKGMPCGTPVTAPAGGKVLNSGWKPWGGQVDVLVPGSSMPPGYDSSSNYVLSFLHLSRQDVAAGSTVTAGQQIGLSGQPPPGQGFGSGCHLHFEVTHGNVPPYQGQYSPWAPTKTSYPQNGQAFIDYVSTNGLIQSNATAEGSGSSSSSSSSGGAWDIVKGIASGIFPALGPILNAPGASTSSIASTIGTGFSELFSWITSPIRIIKMVAGLGLITLALFVTFLPDIAAAGVTAAGVPEAAPLVRGALAGNKGPRGITKSAIGTAGAVRGRKVLAKRELKGRLAAHEAEHKQRQEWGRQGAKRAAQNKADRGRAPGVTPEMERQRDARRKEQLKSLKRTDLE